MNGGSNRGRFPSAPARRTTTIISLYEGEGSTSSDQAEADNRVPITGVDVQMLTSGHRISRISLKGASAPELQGDQQPEPLHEVRHLI